MTQELDPLIAWNADDKAWLERYVPAPLRHIAVRYGRTVYTLTMHSGTAGHALGLLVQRSRGHRQQLGAIYVLQGILNELIEMACGELKPQIMNCKRDVEQLVELSNGTITTNGPVSPSGIILDS